MNRVAWLLALPALGGCDLLDGGTDRTLIVLHHQVECSGVAVQLCLLVREPGQTGVERMYSTPRGFAYEWGFTYEIRIEEHEVSNPPLDGSSIRRELEQVVSMAPVAAGTEFETFLTASEGRVSEVSSGRFRFYDTKDFTCGGSGDCAALAAAVAAGERIRYRFAHPADLSEPLAVVAWEVCAARLVGSEICR